MSTKFPPKNPKRFHCIKCNFTCSNKKDFNRHVSTAKHKNQHLSTEFTPNHESKHYECDCGKIYKERTGLWRHRQKCNYKNAQCDKPKLDSTIQSNDATSQSNIIFELIRENKEFKQLVIEQNKQIQDTQNQNTELHTQMVEMLKEGKIINNNTTNNNNQRFNINFFLNDTCKDAMNITDFLRNIDVQHDELEYIGHHGYVNGMTKMIMDRLKSMDVTKRPIHCTDIKREIMYIKDKDEWSKDTDELTKLRKILGRISMNNYRAVPDWKRAHPDSELMESQNNEFCYRMMRAILGDVEEEQTRLDNKIIKNMAKEIFVCKR